MFVEELIQITTQVEKPGPHLLGLSNVAHAAMLVKETGTARRRPLPKLFAEGGPPTGGFAFRIERMRVKSL